MFLLMRDPKAVSEMIGMVDKIMPHIIVSPVVRLHYTETTVGKTKVTKVIPSEDREEGIVYTDQIGLEDKMFLPRTWSGWRHRVDRLLRE